MVLVDKARRAAQRANTNEFVLHGVGSAPGRQFPNAGFKHLPSEVQNLAVAGEFARPHELWRIFSGITKPIEGNPLDSGLTPTAATPEEVAAENQPYVRYGFKALVLDQGASEEFLWLKGVEQQACFPCGIMLEAHRKLSEPWGDGPGGRTYFLPDNEDDDAAQWPSMSKYADQVNFDPYRLWRNRSGKPRHVVVEWGTTATWEDLDNFDRRGFTISAEYGAPDWVFDWMAARSMRK